MSVYAYLVCVYLDSPEPSLDLCRTPLVFLQRTGSSLLNTDGSQLYLEQPSFSEATASTWPPAGYTQDTRCAACTVHHVYI